MQTFLPYTSFERSAAALDRQRLGKQRVECKQILLALFKPSYGWQHHPAVKMWRGHPNALATYGWLMCNEWIRRGYQDSLLPFFINIARITESGDTPPWLGDDRVHASHRSALLRKLPTHYAQFDWHDTVPDYYWPV